MESSTQANSKAEAPPPMLAPPAGQAAYTADTEEPYPSLSDFHDYEPNLEFDDTELTHTRNVIADAALPIDLFQEMEPNGMGSPLSDLTDENFEDELAEPLEANFDSLVSSYPEVGDGEKFTEIAKYGIVDVKGDDELGRKIIVVYACKLPPYQQICHEHFLEYLIYTLDKYVEQDYMLVYFHYGLNSKNKPSIRWIWQAYKAFDRKYKKNLKALYMVHPTGFVKFISQVFRPVISVKFGKKLNYINTLQELEPHIRLSQLSIPAEVIKHNDGILSRVGRQNGSGNETDSTPKNLPPTKQFGVSLTHIKAHYKTVIPPIVHQCIQFLDNPDALETEGLFRRSPNALRVKELKEVADRGENLVFHDPHEATVLMKTFLRELKEPLLTYDLYEEVIQFQTISKDQQLRTASILVMEKLPVDNYKILKYIITFLSRVMERADLNKMNPSNLAVVFGPNLIWAEHKSMSLGAIGPINTFVQFLLQHNREIFMI